MEVTNNSKLYKFFSENFQNEKFLEPFIYVLQAADNVWYEKLVLAFNYWLKVPEDKLYEIIRLTQIFLYATEIVDDIEDNSLSRRGLPTPHTIYGVENTLIAVNYIFFSILDRMMKLHPKAVITISKLSLNILESQGLDLYFKDSNTCPTEEEYIKSTRSKNTARLEIFFKLMELFSKENYDFNSFISSYSLYYGIYDDYLDLYNRNVSGENYSSNDISQGSFSFPIIHAIKSNPHDNQIQNILRKKTKENDIIKHCIMLLKKYGSMEYTHNTLITLNEQVREEVKKLGGNPLLEKILDAELLFWMNA